MLDEFREAKQAEIRGLQEQSRSGCLPGIFPGTRPPFAATIRRGGRTSVIAEYKPASPSRGMIRPDLSAADMADICVQGGAGAISVLTEERYFHSSLSVLLDLQGAKLPLLRKDFILDPLQVRQTAATPASALLLIVRFFIHAPDLLAVLHQEARDLGLEAVVEVFDRSDLKLARRIGAGIIQVNNRDLDSLEVDLNTSRRLIAEKKEHELWISASGISRPEEVREMSGHGFNGCLIGTSIMGSSDPLQKLQELARA